MEDVMANKRPTGTDTSASTADDDTSDLSAQEQAEYDDWLRAEVQAAIDDPRPSVPNDEVEREFAKVRAELLKRIRFAQS
jgi:hypothetical protein